MLNNISQPRAGSQKLLALSQTGPDSTMGKLLRRFWQPVGVSSHVQEGKAISVKIMDEELTLYRGLSGKVYLVGGRCAHRRTLMHTGWVQGEEIRCIYHGWKYNGLGECVERPAEPTVGANIKIGGYPTEEYGGLIFAYMGDGDVPMFDLPRKLAFEPSSGQVFPRTESWPCNWFQQIENSLDATHVSFVHQAGRLGAFGAAVSDAVPLLEYEETDAGIRQTAIRGENNVRVSDWTFPNNNHIILPGLREDDPWIHIGVWMVPIDDMNTTRFYLYGIPHKDEDARSRYEEYFRKYGDYNPSDHHDELFNGVYPDDTNVQLTSAQDYVAMIGQGAIADRLSEKLGRSDAGIAFLRRIFNRELENIESGVPTKSWTSVKHHVDMPKQRAKTAAL